MKNNIFLKLILSLVIIFIASIYLPEIFWKTFPQRYYLPRIVYSPILDDILIIKGDFKESMVVDLKGNSYNTREYEALVPQTAFTQLLFLGKLPDTVKGVAFTASELRKNLYRTGVEPAKIDAFKLLMHPLIESKPNRASLSFPNEFFSITEKRMKIVDCRTNIVNEEMSDLFTSELMDKDFTFPAKELFGNPTTRKPFDEGYFVIDSKDQFFHLKRVKNKPYVHKVKLPENSKVVHMEVLERDLHEFFGYFVTDDSKFYMLREGDYHIVNIPIEDYDYKNSVMGLNGDILYRRVNIMNDNKISTFVYDRSYKLITSYKDSVIHKDETTFGVTAAYIFPFTFTLAGSKSLFINFDFDYKDFRFLLINFILVILFAGFLKYKKYDLSKNIFQFLLIAVGGIYGVIAVSVIRDFNQKNSAGVK
ncbi:MAG: DUF4857 domain-containing protein [Ignavibacteria bacterium]|nr:DUF4857 domain-containing protein [Ignavibacteria bacterium]